MEQYNYNISCHKLALAVARLLYPAILCLIFVLIFPLLLAEIAWSSKGLVRNICWVINKADGNQFTAYKILSNIVLAPALEAIPIIACHIFIKKKPVNIFLVFIYGFVIHGLSIYSIGKAFAFVTMYIFSSKNEKKTILVYINLVSIHALWNATASIVTLTRLFGICL